jgi:filamentous hemagglutinin family protein
MSASFLWNRVFFLAFAYSFFCLPTTAQIAPDGTTSTQVDTPDGNNFEINGGDLAGANLFHSFRDFSVPTGGSANFLNSPEINNIISRVTGGSVSTIDGLIKAAGSANLFLINPAGIIFGNGASLNIGGSFLGSSADSLLFNDETEFSATNLQKPLLTVNAPIGLNLRDNPAPINNNSLAGLEVKPGKNVTLVGGNISFDGGKIIAPGGRVELGSLLGAGKIEINDNGSLTFPSGVQRGDITLTNDSEVKVRADGGGFIGVNARNFQLLSGTELIAGIKKGLGKPEAVAGNIDINTTDTVSLDGSKVENQVEENAQGNAGNIEIATGSVFLDNSALLSTETRGRGNAGSVIINAIDTVSLNNKSEIETEVESIAEGKGGNISIETGSLSLLNGAVLEAGTEGKGDAGDVQITASDSIFLDKSRITNTIDENAVGNAGSVIVNAGNTISVDNSTISSRVNKGAIGNSGEITIATKNLSLVNGAGLTATTEGQGNAGKIIINAIDTISLDGRIFIDSRIAEKGVGNSGGIEISTDNLYLTNISGLNATTSGQGDAGQIIIKTTGNSGNVSLNNSYLTSRVNKNAKGNSGGVNITAKNFSLVNNSTLTATTEGQGNAGQIVINAIDSLFLDKKSFINSRVATNGVGDAGGISITAKNLFVSNEAELNVGSFGQGNAGNLQIKTDLFQLNNRGKLTAETSFGEGGNINLKIGGILKLDRNSLISAKARQDATGGNLTIDAQFIVASPNQNSDIVANAEKGKGGDIRITTEGIFGLKERLSTPPNQTNDIDASSQFGLEGSVSIDTPDVNPSQAFILSQENLVEPEETVASACSTDSNDTLTNSFTVTGRGGMPTDPTKPLNSSYLSGERPSFDKETRGQGDKEMRRLGDEETGRQGDWETRRLGEAIKLDEHKKTFSSDEVIPARGMIKNAQGQIVLTAYPTPNTTDRNFSNAIACSFPKSSG